MTTVLDNCSVVFLVVSTVIGTVLDCQKSCERDFDLSVLVCRSTGTASVMNGDIVPNRLLSQDSVIHES